MIFNNNFYISFKYHYYYYVNNSLHLVWNMLRFSSTDIISSKKQSFSREHSLWKTASFEEHIISKNKYLSIFLHQMCLLFFKCFSQHGQFWKLENITCIFPTFSWGIFGHMMGLDHYCVQATIHKLYEMCVKMHL